MANKSCHCEERSDEAISMRSSTIGTIRLVLTTSSRAGCLIEQGMDNALGNAFAVLMRELFNQ